MSTSCLFLGIDSAPAVVYELFNDVISLRPVDGQGKIVFARSFNTTGPELEQFIEELDYLLLLQKEYLPFLN